jgi:quercetin dioxygenase-like cupin family protein
MTESPLLVNEEQSPWEMYPDDEHRQARIRERTFIAADRTPTRSLSMGDFEVPPGAQLDLHHHHPQEVYYVTDGEAEVYLDGRWQPLRKGDVVYFPGDAVHGARNLGTVTCRIVWIFPTDTYEEIEYFDDPVAE